MNLLQFPPRRLPGVTAFARALTQRNPPRVMPFGQRGGGMMGTRPATLPLLAAALVVLTLAAAAFAPLFYSAEAQDGSVPAKPTGLSATATHDQVALSWDDPQDDGITGYVILRRNRDSDAKGEFTELVSDTGSADTSHTDGSVAAETRYTYRIKAINAHGSSERSRWFHIDTSAVPVPAEPTGLSAEVSHDQVALSWDDPGDDSITGYVILRRNRDTDAEGEFTTLVSDTGSAATSHTDESVAAETSYTYRIKAINEHGVSERSRWVHVDTLVAPDPALLAPANLTAATADGRVFLSWDAPVEEGGAVMGYEVLRALGEDEPATLVADTGSAGTATRTKRPRRPAQSTPTG